MIQVEALERAIALIRNANQVLVTTHIKPDGDACGCVSVVVQVLESLGKTARPLFLSRCPQWYAFLCDEPIPVLGGDLQISDLSDGPWADVDLIVVVDTNSYSQLPGLEDYLKRTDKTVLVFDHHVTADGVGAAQVSDPTAAATGMVLFDLLEHAQWPITAPIAEALFVAIATDTGWFQFNNTSSYVYRRCADLIDLGVDPTEVYDKLYQSFSYRRFQLMMSMLETLELQCDGRYASQQILQADFARTGTAYADTENLINECHRIGSVKVSALFVELKDGRIRCSLRSRGAVDVSEIAAQFGGGGHKMAAGAFVPGPIDNARQLILDAVTERLPNAS
jgi:phosphoesterase RecJ-like protein